MWFGHFISSLGLINAIRVNNYRSLIHFPILIGIVLITIAVGIPIQAEVFYKYINIKNYQKLISKFVNV